MSNPPPEIGKIYEFQYHRYGATWLLLVLEGYERYPDIFWCLVLTHDPWEPYNQLGKITLFGGSSNQNVWEAL